MNGFDIPFPQHIKLKTLFKYSIKNADWIETGTYLGETSRALSNRFPKNLIYTIEPSELLHAFVSKKLNKYQNIKFIYGTSETSLVEILSKVSPKVNLWLDGHYSGDVTYSGDNISPILQELSHVKTALSRFTEICIFVDDFRLFGVESGYPTKNELVQWCSQNNFFWMVENDIFVMVKL